jgi:hypothetical protein
MAVEVVEVVSMERQLMLQSLSLSLWSSSTS